MIIWEFILSSHSAADKYALRRAGAGEGIGREWSYYIHLIPLGCFAVSPTEGEIRNPIALDPLLRASNVLNQRNQLI
jgi:hypothetical protein